MVVIYKPHKYKDHIFFLNYQVANISNLVELLVERLLLPVNSDNVKDTPWFIWPLGKVILCSRRLKKTWPSYYTVILYTDVSMFSWSKKIWNDRLITAQAGRALSFHMSEQSSNQQNGYSSSR